MFSAVPNVCCGVKSFFLPWVTTLTNIHREPNLALMLIQGIQGALSNQHFQMNPNNDEPIFCMLVNFFGETNERSKFVGYETKVLKRKKFSSSSIRQFSNSGQEFCLSLHQ
jgi:hypothetical protein